jgi:asparagine synthase (glutamine-hydrolysing)
MCGIAGYLDRSGGNAPTRAQLERMIRALHHRGPDGYGFHVSPPVGLAHARLSIIDLATGDQPIHNEDRSVWVVFNGEIFNYVELRAELSAQGHVFSTQSDTEVIVHLYEQHGLRFVEHLNGQFAIALWDQNQRRLVLCRDRVGIRPLFYSVDERTLAFASEVKALQAAGFGRSGLRPTGLAEVFSLWSAFPGRSVFNGVQSLPPGHLLTLQDGALKIEKYWDWDFDPACIDERSSFDDAAAQLRELLTDAVRLQLRSDVPVGAYLSGGLDSSIVTAAIKRVSSTRMTSYSLTFEDAEFDEREFQQAMVAHLDTEHIERLCTQADIGRSFPLAIWHTETPLVRTAPTPLMLLAERVHQQGRKVVLTGEGADEVFAGYDLFKEAKVRRYIDAHPGSAARRRLVEKLYPYLKHSPAAGKAMAQSFFTQGTLPVTHPAYAHYTRLDVTRRIWRFLSADMRAAIGDWNPEQAIAEWVPARSAGWSDLGRDQYVEAQLLMSGYLLASQGDRVAMAHSVEGRYPYLDHRVIEFANRLPPRYKLGGLREKRILRRAFADFLPPAIAQRVKQPYRSPDSASFFRDGEPLAYVAQLLGPEAIRRAGYFDAAAVELLVKKCRAGKVVGFADNMALVGILSTMLMHELFINGESPGALAA